MDLKGYKRTKKTDIKKWLRGSNSIIYLLILILLLVALLFVLKTIINMNDKDNDKEQPATTSQQESTAPEKESESQYIAKNQMYYIKINVSRNIAIIYKMDHNQEYTIPEKAFYISVGKDVKTGSTHISGKEMSGWKRIDYSTYGHYANRLDNAEYIYSTPYYYSQLGNINVEAYNKIGTSVEKGSIFMTPKDAKWVYENCGINTPVDILTDFPIPDNITVTEFNKISYSNLNTLEE